MVLPMSVIFLQCSSVLYFLTSLFSVMIMAATADKTLQSVLRSLGKDAGSTDASSYEVKLCSPMVVAIRMFTHLCFVLRADW